MADKPDPESAGAGRRALLLRLPPALHEALKALAARELRSVNAQIEFLLAEAVKRRTGRDPR